jgi:cell pole-organizing protein PopZ
MRRDRNDILRSITALLAEVNRVSASLNTSKVEKLSSIEAINSSYLSRQQVSSLTESLIAAVANQGSGVQKRQLESLIASTLDKAIQSWMNQSLKHIVDEVVEQQLASSVNSAKKRAF